jgi:hypothetical protein
MKKAFTITELIVAIGLLAAVLAASTMIFHYAIEAQRTAMATAEIMHTLRAITDQLDADFASLRKDGYLVLRSDDANSALYFFSTGDFISWENSKRRSNTARVYFGPPVSSPNDLALDTKLLTPSNINGLDYNNVSFIECQTNIKAHLLEEPCEVLSPISKRPAIDMNSEPNDARRLLAQNINRISIEWTDGTISSGLIQWYGRNTPKVPVVGASFETLNLSHYVATWTPLNQPLWPKALKFTFTLYDSKGILKTGRRFEHIVYIGN